MNTFSVFFSRIHTVNHNQWQFRDGRDNPCALFAKTPMVDPTTQNEPMCNYSLMESPQPGHIPKLTRRTIFMQSYTNLFPLRQFHFEFYLIFP